MTKVYLITIPEQSFEVEANDEADADYVARDIIDISSIELVEEDE